MIAAVTAGEKRLRFPHGAVFSKEVAPKGEEKEKMELKNLDQLHSDNTAPSSTFFLAGSSRSWALSS